MLADRSESQCRVFLAHAVVPLVSTAVQKAVVQYGIVKLGLEPASVMFDENLTTASLIHWANVDNAANKV